MSNHGGEGSKVGAALSSMLSQRPPLHSENIEWHNSL